MLWLLLFAWRIETRVCPEIAVFRSPKRLHTYLNDTDRRNNSALFGGTVSDRWDALAFFIHQPNNSRTDRLPVSLGLHRCGSSVSHADLLRVRHLNLRYDQPTGRLADGGRHGANLLGEPSFGSYQCWFIGVAMVALATQTDSAG